MPLLLVTDANVLVSELLRVRGRMRLAHPELELVITQEIWGEVRHELPKRVALLTRDRELTPEASRRLLANCFATIEANITTVSDLTYAPLETEARWRIARDPNDWSSVALALTLGAGIWSEDRDYFGCGVATWTTDTLTRFLSEFDAARQSE